MTARDTYLRYPSPQMITAVARGRAPLPEDPELRAIVVRLADRYLKKREAAAQPGPPLQQTSQLSAKDLNDGAGLELKVKMSDMLTPSQIDILSNGKPQEKE
jgi:hypothetical protein